MATPIIYNWTMDKNPSSIFNLMGFEIAYKFAKFNTKSFSS
jgi:hypothetical protein